MKINRQERSRRSSQAGLLDAIPENDEQDDHTKTSSFHPPTITFLKGIVWHSKIAESFPDRNPTVYVESRREIGPPLHSETGVCQYGDIYAETRIDEHHTNDDDDASLPSESHSPRLSFFEDLNKPKLHYPDLKSYQFTFEMKSTQVYESVNLQSKSHYSNPLSFPQMSTASRKRQAPKTSPSELNRQWKRKKYYGAEDADGINRGSRERMSEVMGKLTMIDSYATGLSTVDQPAPQYNVQALRPERKEIGTKTEPIEIIPAIPPTIESPNLDKDSVKLEWYPDLDSTDSLGMEHVFREDESLEPQPNKDEGWKEEDLDWGINPKLTRKQRRLWIKMLRKHLKIFSSRISKLEAKADQTSQPKANKTSQSK
jgi:hypothetical protein